MNTAQASSSTSTQNGLKITMADEEAQQPDQQKQPLLDSKNLAMLVETQETLIQKAISRTFKSTAHLANLLPTGTILAFQLLAPVLTNQGRCDAANKGMTGCLLALCAISCFILSFTDSFRDGAGKVRYGLATLKGLWVIDGAAALPPEKAASYRIRVIDLFHACMSVLVFATVALFDKNVVACFYPVPSEEAEQLLVGLPVGIGVVCSMLFVVFPTTRHGIGFPLSTP